MKRNAKLLWTGLLISTALLACAGKDELSPRIGSSGVEAITNSAAELAVSNSVDDGPYLRRTAAGIEASWVCAGAVVRKQFGPPPVVIAPVCGYNKAITVRAPAPLDAEAVVTGVSRLVAVSDPHGQYDTLLQLLRAHQVVDADGNWNLGAAHLVMTGDVFDRGHQVTEIFWLLYQLEQQARSAGGRLHFLLGNHEYMVLANDLRYVNGKYLRAAELLGQSYPALYGADSVLGQWLRQRDTIRQIDHMLFMHAGIQDGFFQLNLSLAEANQQYRRSLGLTKPEVKADPILAALHDANSPIWYRGYFLDESLTQQQVDAIAARFGVQHIIVGHTSQAGVTPLFNQRVIGIDTSIKEADRGELLWFEHGRLTRARYDGSVELL